MKTETLIRALAADTQVERRPGHLALATLPLALVTGLVALWLVLGFRDDLLASLAVPESVLRFLLTGTLGLAGIRIGVVLARPEGRALVRFWPILVVALVAGAAVIWALLVTPPGARQMALVGKTMVTCLVTIPLLSILPVTAIMVALRQGATTAPALAGLAAGLGGSGLSAMIYALHCTEDSPLFFVTWYGLAMVGVTVVATLIGARWLHW